MAFYPPATCSPAWPVDKFAEVPLVPFPPSSVTPPQLPNLLLDSPQPSTPSSHALPSIPPLSFSNAAAAATEQPWAPPTISTFSTSASLHIVQPYLREESDPANSVKQSGLLSAMSSQTANRPRRPANAWILYRSDKMKDLKPTEPSAPRRTQADISKLIAEMWRNETEEVKRYYETLSDLAKAEHHAQYPTYRFQPAKKTEKPRGQKKARKAELRAERGTNAHRIVSSTFTPLQERSANSQPERHSIDDALSSQRPSCSQKTVPAFPSAPIFVPYQVPPRPRSSAMRETQRPTRPQPSAESHDLRPTLSPLVTTFSASSAATSMPGEPASSASSEAPTRFAPHWLEQSTPSTTFTQYPAHSDRSHAYNSPITTNHERSSAAPTVWTPSTTSYEYPLDPAQSAGLGFIHTEPQPLSRIPPGPYVDLFTHPGASVEVALPCDFNYPPEMGEFGVFEQWFGPGGLDISGYPTFSDPTPFQQPPHRLPHHTTGEHEFTKQEPPALRQPSGKRGVLAYPTPPPCSPHTPMPLPVPYGFSQVAAPTKSEHPGLYSSPPPAMCHYVGHQQGWEPYQPLAPT